MWLKVGLKKKFKKIYFQKMSLKAAKTLRKYQENTYPKMLRHSIKMVEVLKDNFV